MRSADDADCVICTSRLSSATEMLLGDWKCWKPSVSVAEATTSRVAATAAALQRCTDLQPDYIHVQHLPHSRRVIIVSTSKPAQESPHEKSMHDGVLHAFASSRATIRISMDVKPYTDIATRVVLT